MQRIQTFNSAKDVSVENGLNFMEAKRRKVIVRRQLVVDLCGRIGWNFLKIGEVIKLPSFLLIGLSLSDGRDLKFLDLLRIKRNFYFDKEVYLFQIEKPYILPIPFKHKKTPIFALFEDRKLIKYFEGEDAYAFLRE